MSAPTAVDLVAQALEALGMNAPISARGSETPAAVWEACLELMRGLSEGRCWVCMEKDAASVPVPEPSEGETP